MGGGSGYVPNLSARSFGVLNPCREVHKNNSKGSKESLNLDQRCTGLRTFA